MRQPAFGAVRVLGERHQLDLGHSRARAFGDCDHCLVAEFGRAAQPLELLVGLDESQPLELPGHVDDLADTIAKRQVVRVWHPHLERRVDADEPNSARRS